MQNTNDLNDPYCGEDVIKYETRNPLAQRLLRGFFSALGALGRDIQFSSVYEAACGEGYITEFLIESFRGITVNSTDISESKIAIARQRVPNGNFSTVSIYNTKENNESYDLVIATEVFEHLDDPEKAIKELLRISKKYLIVSVPNEPIWRLCNIARGKYIQNLGNTPGHINHWNRNSFCRLLDQFCAVRQVKCPLPWVMLLCEK
jgi:2-polyprenyl-3-methyl-5-hydroxy-6-metoxy-1,4-benzoquinol methylase